MTDERIISPEAAPGETHDRALRPQTLGELSADLNSQISILKSQIPPWLIPDGAPPFVRPMRKTRRGNVHIHHRPFDVEETSCLEVVPPLPDLMPL